MAKKTVIQKAARDKSAILGQIKLGLGAMRKQDRALIDSEVATIFEDSVDIDEVARPGNEQENRWDYLLGVAEGGRLVALEPHTASEGEVSVVIAKRAFSKEFLSMNLKDGKKVERWLWVASGKVGFLDTEKARRRLDQNGIEFVGRAVTSKSFPKVATRTVGKKKAAKRPRDRR
jgi:hypothetical protein